MTSSIAEKNRKCREEYVDEYIMILCAKEGCQICTHQLYSRYHDMVALYCRKASNRMKSLTADDLIGQCYVYFIGAIRKFDIDSGFKFGTYLYTQLQQISRYALYHDNSAIKLPADYLQNLKADKIHPVKPFSIDSKVDDEMDNSMTWNEVLADESALAELIAPEQIEALRMAIAALPETQEAILMHQMEGKTFEEIGEHLGLDKKQVAYQRKKAIEEIRWKLKFWEN